MANKTVLVIDDSLVVREQVRDTLRAASYDVLEAENGIEALAHVKATPALSLVICDVNMPEMGGLELLAELKNQGLMSFHVIMLTSEGRPEFLAKARTLGAKAWMMKPLVAEKLLAVVQKLTA